MNLHLGFSIEIRYQLFGVNKHTGKERPLSGKFGNKILTSGMQEMANQNWFTYCQVGTDNTLPNANQTALLGHVAGTNSIQQTDYNATDTAPHYGWRRRRFRFAVGAAAGNLNEIAIGWAAGPGDTIATRALIVDVDGNQTTVTPKDDEYLDAVIEIRYYPPTGDSTGQVLLDGVVYNYILRAAHVTSADAWGKTVGDKIASYAVSNGDWAFYDDDIADITLGPNGVPYSSDNSNDFTNPYEENSFEIGFGMIAGPSGWNASTNKFARSLRFKTTAGWYQIQFSRSSIPNQGIPKTSDFTLRMQFRLGWAEKV